MNHFLTVTWRIWTPSVWLLFWKWDEIFKYNKRKLVFSKMCSGRPWLSQTDFSLFISAWLTNKSFLLSLFPNGTAGSHFCVLPLYKHTMFIPSYHAFNSNCLWNPLHLATIVLFSVTLNAMSWSPLLVSFLILFCSVNSHYHLLYKHQMKSFCINIPLYFHVFRYAAALEFTVLQRSTPAIICLFKVNNRNRKMSEICSGLTVNTPERCHWCRSGVFIVNFEHISQLFWCFYCWLWMGEC